MFSPYYEEILVASCKHFQNGTQRLLQYRQISDVRKLQLYEYIAGCNANRFGRMVHGINRVGTPSRHTVEVLKHNLSNRCKYKFTTYELKMFIFTTSTVGFKYCSLSVADSTSVKHYINVAQKRFGIVKI